MEGKNSRNLYKALKGSARIEYRVTTLVRSHANLVVAFMIAAVILRLHTAWLLTGLLTTGLLTYFAGASLGLLSSVIITGLQFHVWAVHGFPDSSHIVLQTISYWCNVWLAYQHRQEKVHHQNSHRDQIMPWTVANEIRNSLAGIRFVLFPMNGNAVDTDIQRVTDEIAKIEQLFEEIEQQNIGTKR